MSFGYGGIEFSPVGAGDVATVQEVLDHAGHYHTEVLKMPAHGMGARALNAPAPASADGGRVFRHFLVVSAPDTYHRPVAVLDLYAGVPNYRTASIAMLVVREEVQRHGIGGRVLTGAVPAFLREYHPAVTGLSISVTDNNTAALRCLLKYGFSYSGAWGRIDDRGRQVTAVTYTRTLP